MSPTHEQTNLSPHLHDRRRVKHLAGQPKNQGRLLQQRTQMVREISLKQSQINATSKRHHPDKQYQRGEIQDAQSENVRTFMTGDCFHLQPIDPADCNFVAMTLAS